VFVHHALTGEDLALPFARPAQGRRMASEDALKHGAAVASQVEPVGDLRRRGRCLPGGVGIRTSTVVADNVGWLALRHLGSFSAWNTCSTIFALISACRQGW
jgi:hypothetical protein